jgi:hypothetical protein
VPLSEGELRGPITGRNQKMDPEISHGNVVFFSKCRARTKGNSWDFN